jgi:hypothetical protein
MPVPRDASRRVAAFVLILSSLAAFPAALVAQSTARQTSGPLYDELVRMDSLLFDAAFVSCDAEKFRTCFTEDAEFYHDLGGASFGDEVRTLRGCPRERGVQRMLVPGSLEVYPMNGYGAIQMGAHRFVEAGAETSTIARFVHLWRQENSLWRITRVLSFEHMPESQ